MNAIMTGSVENGEFQKRINSEDPEKAKRVLSAVKFLVDPRVKLTPIANKVLFLKSKGLSTEEICEAFQKTGQPKSMEEIKRIMNQQNCVPVVPVASNSSLPSKHALGDSTYAAHQGPVSPYAGPLYTPQPPPFPQTRQESKEADWRDYVIAVGATLLGGFAAFKAFQIYSPYEIRRKDERTKSRPGNVTERRRHKSGRRASSESDIERPSLSQNIPALPMPATPTPNTSNTANGQDEVSRLQTEVKETQDALEKEKKSKAELSVTLGKLRGQLLAQTRANERQESKIKSLQEELDKQLNEAGAPKTTDENVGVASGEVCSPQVGAGMENTLSSPLPPVTACEKSDGAALEQSPLPVLRASEVVEEQ
ncbi:peroxin 14 [Trypanosoma grayi]|uniref:peroxin 14 n=1 Tax=Trypanosoma grayi TaxID=71804 RepID=UPI0004F489E7|nr:peroxin 14 [Trypanosoma grayi]KEG11980.1 peroxin 14 [Trypanosoma grayi]